MRAALRDSLLATTWGYAAYMALRWGGGRRDVPRVDWPNKALQTQAEVDAAVAEAKRLRLPVMEDPPKNWDTLAAVHAIVSRTTPDAVVLDAGAEIYSRFLPWMYLFGYRRLYGINLVFDRTRHHGPITYEQGDITKTRFETGYFDAVTCLSVVEHGVDLDKYFAEMARILKKGGVLVTSTDYFETPTDTRGLSAYGTPIRVFTRTDIEAAIATAATHGLTLTSTPDLTTRDRVVRWAQFDLSYSFVVLTMVRS